MAAILSLLIGYLMGTINPAYIISKMKGFDIRDQGSGNAGASNATVMMGKTVGVLCAVFDIFKGFAAYKLGRILFPALKIAGILAGVGCILGHIFPIWMSFRGGKGLASLAGVVLAHNWKLFLCLLTFEVVFGLLTQYICLVSTSAAVLFPVCYGVQTCDLIGILALSVVAIVMLLKHTENFKRIAQGAEVRISYLWDRESELERLKEFYPDGEDSAR